MLKKRKYAWEEIYPLLIPSIVTIIYGGYLFFLYTGKIKGNAIEESACFVQMLETIVTFVSIILGVYGFLLPTFVSSKVQSTSINYFLSCVDVRNFSMRLKEVVVIGLINILNSCALLISDIIPELIVNIFTLYWMWMLLFFVCNSCRFINLILCLLVTEKKNFMQKSGNQVEKDVIDNLDLRLRKIDKTKIE